MIHRLKQCYTNNQKFKGGSETNVRNSSKDLELSFKAMQDRAEFIFDNLCKLAERLANEEKIKVIMRPHPSDDLETIKKLMFKSSQIYLLNNVKFYKF